MEQLRRNRVTVGVLLVVLAAVPTAVWSKMDRSTATVRPERGAARGIVKAGTQAVLYTQVQGRVSQVPYKEGQRFAKGATLVQLDCDKYQAELSAAAAEHEGKSKALQNNKALAQLNAISAIDLEISETEVKKTLAARRIAEINVRSCHVTAPFAGRVVGVMVNEHENVFPNDKLLSVLDDTSIEIELVLPSASLSWLRRKSKFTFAVDEMGRGYPARIKEIGANVDAASQTVKVIGVFETLPANVISGMSGSAQFVEQP
ncbi:MAG: efflux RND transporter periplasmic adaptor subunit [Nitrospira sp.]|nr:efflux RND transporter periplasmic adaptor subunit [Nitrospira sp.]